MSDEKLSRREAVEIMKRDYKQHIERNGGQPSSREVERWGNELGRRNDRQDSDGPKRRG